MPLHDLGYRRWSGPRNPQFFRWWVIAQTGVRLAWGSRWLRRLLVLAWLPAALCGVAFFALEKSLTEPSQMVRVLRIMSRNYPQADLVADELEKNPSQARVALWPMVLLTFFRLPQGVITVMLVALIAPPLIARDLRSRAYLLYFSRPITRLEYVFGKIAVVAAYLLMVTLVPGIALYVLGVALSPEFAVVYDTWDLPLRVAAASIIVIIPTVTFALALSALLGESRYATFCWFAPWVLGFVAFVSMTAMNETRMLRGRNPLLISNKWSLLSPYHTLGEVQTWVFGIEKDFANVAAEACLLSVVTFFSMIVLLRKVAAPMRV
ncbi:ABC transporter permease subunit [Caulifigura coniformis]|uniref:ABC transporter permease subunit n=1 Tax=Caulifigura coniformis TaxID=2527983 RepID=UPI0011A1E6D3|nr:ABC transporter permease subunit [Caulifigura coniformis]